MIESITEVLRKLKDPEVIAMQGEYEVLSIWGKLIVAECADMAKVNPVYVVEDDSEEGCHDEYGSATHIWGLGGDWNVIVNRDSIIAIQKDIK